MSGMNGVMTARWQIRGDGAQVTETGIYESYLDALEAIGATEVSDRDEARETEGRVALECGSGEQYLVYACAADALRDWDGGAGHLAIATVDEVAS